MTGPLIGALDQGTTSTRFMIFDRAGKVVSVAQEEHTQIFPKPGWVEHDPIEIIDKVRRVIGAALSQAGITASGLAAVGVTNQRETTVIWDRKTGRPVSQRHRLAGHPHGRNLPASRVRPAASIVFERDRFTPCHLLLRSQGGLDPRKRPGLAGPGGERRTLLRHHRFVGVMEPDRRAPRHRCHQRLANDADGSTNVAMERRNLRGHGNPDRPPSRDRPLIRPDRRKESANSKASPSAESSVTNMPRYSVRPVSIPVRPRTHMAPDASCSSTPARRSSLRRAGS